MDGTEKHQYLSKLRTPVIQSAIRALGFQPGSQGLDVGCGNGSHTIMLADAVLPGGHVTGLDLSPKQLAYARAAAEASNLSAYVTFREGDMRHMPFSDDTFDWVWSMDCVGYAPFEPLPLIQELVRVVKPGGRIALLAWSSQNLLPGYPAFEALINRTTSGIAPFVPGNHPKNHFTRTLGWFRDAGLETCTAHTFAGSAHAPLPPELHAELLALFKMRWPGIQSELSPDDWAEYQRLCLTESPDFILDHPAYYAFFTYSMFQGVVPECEVHG